MPVGSTSKQGTSNVRSISSATLHRNQVSQFSKVRRLVQPPTKTSLLGTWLRRLEWRPMLQQIRWRQARVRAEAGATALADSKGAMGALLSTTAFLRLPSLRCNKQMLHRSLRMARMKTAPPAPAQDRPRQVQSRLAKTAALLSHHSGEGTMLVISFAMHVVRKMWRRLRREYTLIMLPRSLLQASRHPSARCNEEARDQTSKTCRSCWRQQLASCPLGRQLLSAPALIANPRSRRLRIS